MEEQNNIGDVNSNPLLNHKYSAYVAVGIVVVLIAGYFVYELTNNKPELENTPLVSEESEPVTLPATNPLENTNPLQNSYQNPFE